LKLRVYIYIIENKKVFKVQKRHIFMSGQSLAEIATKSEPEETGRIGEVDEDFSRDFSKRRVCLACGIHLHTGSFCSQNCGDAYSKWIYQKRDYVGHQNLTQTERFFARWGVNYAPVAVA